VAQIGFWKCLSVKLALIEGSLLYGFATAD
jgi:hypothetical protein